MTDTTKPVRRAPLHLWIVGLAALTFNAQGLYYASIAEISGSSLLMAGNEIENSVTRLGYLFWAFGLVSGIAGSVLMLLRKRLAVLAFIGYLIGVLGSYLYPAIASGLSTLTLVDYIASSALAGIGLLFFIYSGAMMKRGVLR